MKKLVALLSLCSLSALASPKSRFIVTVPEGKVTEKIAQVNSTLVTESDEIKPEKVLPSIDAFVAELSPSQIEALRKSGAKITPDRERHVLGFPDNPFFDLERNLDFTYGLENIGVIELRSAYPEILGEKVVVGIIDSGIDPNHPAFAGKEIVFKDFTASKKTQPYDDNGHGTHVAGTISGIGLPNFGIAPKVKLVIAKVFSASGRANDSTILAAMEWVQTQGVSVVNNSWGGDQDSTNPDEPYNQMVKSWLSKNIFPSFAAGNSGPKEGTVGIPGGYVESFAVGAVDDKDKLSAFSSKGPIVWNGKKYEKPEICAPGSRVYSSVPNGKYSYFSGTSMATPHVTGVVALLKQANPKITVSEIREVLQESAKNIELKTNECGSGRLDAKAAVDKVLGK